MHCPHCGRELTGAGYFLNGWLVVLECRPLCPEGRAWYDANTILGVGRVRFIPPEREQAVRQQRLELHALAH